MKELADLHVTIVGLGLMGGSLALALRPHVDKLSAVDIERSTLDLALEKNVVHQVTDNLEEGIASADLVVLATPVRTIQRQIAILPKLRPDGCMLLDLGSTKTQISASMGDLPIAFQAIGGHPMCGREVAGLRASSADLFHRNTFVLCRCARTTPVVEYITLMLIQKIGARPLILPAEEHDRMVAAASHLPYAVSVALMRQVGTEAEAEPQMWQLSASGFRDTSRLAGSSPKMMLDILLTNRTAVLDQLGAYRSELETLMELIRDERESDLAGRLVESQRLYQAYRKYQQET